MPRITVTLSNALYKRLKAKAGGDDSTLSRTAARLLADALAGNNEQLPAQDATWGRYSDDWRGEYQNWQEGDQACTRCGASFFVHSDHDHSCKNCGEDLWKPMTAEKAVALRKQYETSPK